MQLSWRSEDVMSVFESPTYSALRISGGLGVEASCDEALISMCAGNGQANSFSQVEYRWRRRSLRGVPYKRLA